MNNRIITKKEIVKKISEETNLTQVDTKIVVQKTLDAIVDSLVETGRIELRNFGVFESVSPVRPVIPAPVRR